jgi:hypothetical protein
MKGRDHWKTWRRWENNIKMGLKEIGWRGVGGLGLFGSEKGPVAVSCNKVMNLPLLFVFRFLTRAFHDLLRSFLSCSLSLNEVASR